MRPALGHAQIGAFADYLGTDIGRVDTQRVIRPVIGLGLGFGHRP